MERDRIKLALWKCYVVIFKIILLFRLNALKQFILGTDIKLCNLKLVRREDQVIFRKSYSASRTQKITDFINVLRGSPFLIIL